MYVCVCVCVCVCVYNDYAKGCETETSVCVWVCTT